MLTERIGGDMRYCVCPIAVLRQDHLGVVLWANGYDVGYDELVYQKRGVTSSRKSVPLSSNEIRVSDFPLGSGYYTFFLKKDNKKSAPLTVYVLCETLEQTIEKVCGAIVPKIPMSYTKKNLPMLTESAHGYTAALTTGLPLDRIAAASEKTNAYRLIAAFERYENALCLLMNRVAAGKTKVFYTDGISIFPGDNITHAEIYQIEGNMRYFFKKLSPADLKTKLFLAPSVMYAIDLFSDGDLLTELYHYEPSQDFFSPLWRAAISAEMSAHQAEEAAQSDSLRTDLSQEHVRRMAEEKQKENANAFLPSPIVSQSIYHDGRLDIEIKHFDVLSALHKLFYLSVKERDQLFDTTFYKRYPITSPTMKLDAKRELLAGELIFYVEDGEGIIVSDFTRIDLSDGVHFGEMQEYKDARRAEESMGYVHRYLKNLSALIGEGELYFTVSNTINEKMSDTDSTPEDIFHHMLTKAAIAPIFERHRGDLLSFTANEWMRQKNTDDAFFASAPIFINATDTFIFPASKSKYALIVEEISTTQSSVASVAYKAHESSPEHSISVNVAHGELYLIYAIDAATYKRSGFVLVNNIGTREYYTGQIRLEAKSHG